jgi:hypothetical protein
LYFIIPQFLNYWDTYTFEATDRKETFMRTDGLSEANTHIEIWGRVDTRRCKLLIYFYVTVSDVKGLIQKYQENYWVGNQ